MTDEREWCKNPHCTDLDCPVHSTPESKPEAEVVERLEKLVILPETFYRYARIIMSPALRDAALTLIHNLQVELDRIATENTSYTTRIGELKAENERLRKQNERLKRALREYGRPENCRTGTIRGALWMPDHKRVGIPAWEDPTHIANLALGRQPG